MDRILEPHSVAVIGASDNPAKRGYQIIKALQSAGYDYPIFPVNPKGGTILNLTAFTSIDDLPVVVDVAVIVRPAGDVPDILLQCGRRGIAGAVVVAHGFGERGANGSVAELKLREALATSGVRVLGPNTSGMLNCSVGADLIGLPELPPVGPISVLTQSGNMILTVVEDSRSLCGPGFDVIAGLGNQVDAGYDEIVDELGRRDRTRSIAIYNEGFSNGRRFLDCAARVNRSRPIVMLRGVRSTDGERAALSHTGSIAAADAVALRVLPQMGVTLVDRSDELLPIAALLATTPLPKAGSGVAVLADGGGHATLAIDALSRAGVPLATLSEATKANLRRVLGDEATVDNPIDVYSAIDAHPDVFHESIEILAEDKNVGLVLVTGMFGAYHIRFDHSLLEVENSAAKRIVAIQKESALPLIFHSCYANRYPENHRMLRDSGIQVFSSLDWATTGCRVLFQRPDWLSKQLGAEEMFLPKGPIVDIPPGLSSETAARRILKSLDIDTGKWSAAGSAESVETAVRNFGCACAVKVDSGLIAHKSDIGAVKLDVSQDTATTAASAISSAVAQQVSLDASFGYIVTPMVSRGVELFVGATCDPVFGPVVLFGSGGVLVEAAKDVTFRAAPFSPDEALDMIKETRVSKVLDGFRNLPKVDRQSLANFISAVSYAITRMNGFSELDINPIIANEAGIHPVDVRLVGK